MIHCTYCNSYLVKLPYLQNVDQLFCSNCNCSFYIREEGLAQTLFSFYYNMYYFNIVIDYINNNSHITGTCYPTTINNKTKNFGDIITKKFNKTFDSIINITPQNAKDKIKLYMLFS